MECQCILKTVLVGERAKSIRSVFKILGKKVPKGEMLGVIDRAKSQFITDCPFRYSLGFDYYCDNQSFIKQYKEQKQKDLSSKNGAGQAWVL